MISVNYEIDPNFRSVSKEEIKSIFYGVRFDEGGKEGLGG